MTSLVTGRFAIPPRQRTVRLPGLVLLAAALLLLRPATHAVTAIDSGEVDTAAVQTDTASEAARPPGSGLTPEAPTIDSNAVEAAAVDADTASVAIHTSAYRQLFPARRGLRLDGSTGIWRDWDRRPLQALVLGPQQRRALLRWRKMYFTHVPAVPPKAEPERKSAK